MKHIGFKRLEEFLQTVNTNVIKTINIELSSSCGSDMPFWADVKIGYNTYRIMLGDMDIGYWEDGINCFFNIIKQSKLEYTCNEYYQQTCYSNYKIWKI